MSEHDATKPEATEADATKTDVTKTDVPAPETSSGKPRRPMVMAIAGVALLVIGGVTFALGQSASSKSSDDLARAKAKLSEQKAATADSKQRSDEIQQALAELKQRASDLLTTSDQVVVLDSEVVSSAQAQQQAGVADQFSPYNEAAARGNRAGDSLNALIDTGDQQISAFLTALSAFG